MMLPKQRRFIGIMLFIVGLTALTFTGLVVGLTFTARADAAERFTQDQQMCVSKLRALNGEISELPGRITWTSRGLDRAPALLGESSVAAITCPGWELVRACVGSQCPEKDAIQIVLEQKRYD